MIPMIYLSVLKSEEDKVKFEEIYNEYRQALFLSAYSILHDPEDAEDVVEDTFLTVADNFTEISQKSRQKMKAYIVIINRNNAINKYNENKRRSQNIDYNDLEEQVTPEQLNMFEFEDLRAAIEKLPDKYKDIIYLYDLMDVPVEIIADSLNITKDAVYKRASRARGLLKRLLEAGENDE